MSSARAPLLVIMVGSLVAAATLGASAFAWTGSATGSFSAQAGTWSTPPPTPPPAQDVQLNVCVHQLAGKVWHAHFSYNNTTGDKIKLAQSTVTWGGFQLPLWKLPLLAGNYHAFGALFLSETPVTWTVMTKQGATFSVTGSTDSPACAKQDWRCGTSYHGSDGITFGITSLDGDVEEDESAPAGPSSFAAPSSTQGGADSPREDDATHPVDDGGSPPPDGDDSPSESPPATLTGTAPGTATSRTAGGPALGEPAAPSTNEPADDDGPGTLPAGADGESSLQEPTDEPDGEAANGSAPITTAGDESESPATP